MRHECGEPLRQHGVRLARGAQSPYQAGVELLACVTCLEFFGLTERMALGEVSNMRAIAQLLMEAGKVITV